MRIRVGLGWVVIVAMAVTGLAGCADDAPRVGAAPVVTAEPAMATASGAVVEEEPVITHRRERQTIRIPYRTVTRKTAALKRGVTKVARKGRPGLRVKVFRVTLEDGVRVDRELVASQVRRRPVNRLVLKGTRVVAPAPSGGRCDRNYSGCVPIASDVDCAGGSGNGPRYVQGPVKVVGSDIYDLDADGDGWGCD